MEILLLYFLTNSSAFTRHSNVVPSQRRRINSAISSLVFVSIIASTVCLSEYVSSIAGRRIVTFLNNDGTAYFPPTHKLYLHFFITKYSAVQHHIMLSAKAMALSTTTSEL